MVALVLLLSAPAMAASLDACGSGPAGTVDREFVLFGIEIPQLTERQTPFY